MNSERFENLMKVNWDAQIMNLNYKIGLMKEQKSNDYKEMSLSKASDAYRSYSMSKQKKNVQFILPDIA